MANDNMGRGFSRAYNLALGHSLRRLWQPHAALFRGPGKRNADLASTLCCLPSASNDAYPMQGDLDALAVNLGKGHGETLCCGGRVQGLGSGSCSASNLDPRLRPGPDCTFFW